MKNHLLKNWLQIWSKKKSCTDSRAAEELLRIIQKKWFYSNRSVTAEFDAANKVENFSEGVPLMFWIFFWEKIKIPKESTVNPRLSTSNFVSETFCNIITIFMFPGGLSQFLSKIFVLKRRKIRNDSLVFWKCWVSVIIDGVSYFGPTTLHLVGWFSTNINFWIFSVNYPPPLPAIVTRIIFPPRGTEHVSDWLTCTRSWVKPLCHLFRTSIMVWRSNRKGSSFSISENTWWKKLATVIVGHFLFNV